MGAYPIDYMTPRGAAGLGRGGGGGHGGGGHHGGGHHGGGHHGGGRVWGGGGGGAYFAPGGGYPYLVEDYGPTLLIVGNDDCANRVRNACYQQFSQDTAKQAGCTQAGLARCGTAGVGALEMPALDWKQIGAGLLVGVGIGYVFFATK